jgi:hypothetical protein
MLGSSRVAAQLADSQEGLRSMSECVEVYQCSYAQLFCTPSILERNIFNRRCIYHN